MTMTITNTDERIIAQAIIRTALAKGWAISVNDGEEWTLRSSTDPVIIEEHLASTDGDWLRFREHGKSLGAVYLIWGNGRDLISDASDNPIIEAFLDEVAGSIAPLGWDVAE